MYTITVPTNAHMNIKIILFYTMAVRFTVLLTSRHISPYMIQSNIETFLLVTTYLCILLLFHAVHIE
jgi:hypothetical protein